MGTLNLSRHPQVYVKTGDESIRLVTLVSVWSQATREHMVIANMEERDYLLYTVSEFITWGLGSSFQDTPRLSLHAAKQKDEIGYFWVPLCLCFKASLNAKPFLRKWLHENETARRTPFHVESFTFRLILKQTN